MTYQKNISIKQKAVIYCRVSSNKQEDEGHGLESQETRCRQHADMKGYEVAAVFPDTITGGGDFMKRPGMVALLSFLDAQPHENFVIIFDDLKRFARDTRFHLDLRDAFRSRNVRIECLNFRFDETPEGKFMEIVFAAQGELEREQNGRQVAQKMQARMENGYWIHNAPIGYKYETIKGRGKILVLDPPFDAIIKQAFEGYASGRFSAQAEVKRFLEQFPDFPLSRDKNGEFKQQRIADLLSKSVYTGYICSETYNINWLKGQHEPLITLETFEKVQDRRQDIARAPKRKNIGDQFVLRGIVACAGCDVPLRSNITRDSKGGHYPYYLCQTKTCDHYGKSLKRDEVENDIGDLIKTLQPTKGLMALATAMVKHAFDHKQFQTKDIVRTSKAQIKAIDKQIDAVLTRIMDATNETIIGTYEKKIATLEKEKRLLTENMTNQAAPKATFEEKLEPVLQFLANPHKLWEKGSTALRRTILKLAFSDHIQYDRFEGPRTPQIALPFKALKGVCNHQMKGGAGEEKHIRLLFNVLSITVVI